MLPVTVPALPSRPAAGADVEAQALRRRVDIAIARVEVDALAKALGLADATHVFADAELAGSARTIRSDEGTLSSAEVELEATLNLFDLTGSRRRAAEQRYQRAVNLLLATAVTARSEAREAYQVYRATYDIARLYERQILPVRRLIEEETLLFYNAMIADIPALIADARARILSNVQAIDARRDFWIADANLHAALVGVTSGPQIGISAAASLPAAADAGGH
jgi:outer membrane protein TolC